MSALILEGPIPAAGVGPVLQAVGIGRQTSAVRLFEGAAIVGQLWLRAGKVLAAEYGAADGAAALRAILGQRAGTFAVSTESLDPLPEPIGDLRAMLGAVGGAHGQISLLRGLHRPAPHSNTGVQSLPTLAVSPEAAAPTADAPRPSETPPGSGGPPRVASVRPPASPPPSLASRLAAAEDATAPAPSAPADRSDRSPVAVAPAVSPDASAASRAVPLPRSLTQSFASAAPARAPIVTPVDEPAPAVASPAAPLAPSRAVPIIAVASAKGGVGKTTISLNTAVALARRGLQVTLIDADPAGGVSAAINAHERRTTGTFDVLAGSLRFSDAVVVSRMSSLRVLPAGGVGLSFDQIDDLSTHRGGWQVLIRDASRDADIVIIDTPAGTYGSTRVLLSCASHVFGVLQAEPIAIRVADHLHRALLASSPAPAVLGFVVNMFDSRSAASASVLQDACRLLPPGQVFETPIPRTNVINEASLRGVVPAQADLATAPAIAWAFEQLAAELVSRLALERPAPVLDAAPLF